MHTLLDVFLLLLLGLSFHWGYLQWAEKWKQKDKAWRWYCRSVSLSRQLQQPTPHDD